MATSPRKGPKKSARTGSTKQRKSVKASTKGENRDEIPDESTQETKKQLKVRKPTSRKSIKVVDFGESDTQGAIPVTISELLHMLIPDT